jgi:DNA-binding CsgD family transcriptional regulator
MVLSNLDDTRPGTSDDDSLTVLEARVLDFLWQGKKQATIARAINRSPRTVRRIIHQISAKLGSIDPTFVRLRLEEELLTRIPRLNDRELITALRLYHSVPSSSTPASSIPTSNKSVQQILREVLTRDDADAAGSG